MKTCAKCGLAKPLDAFHPHAGCRQGVRPECRDCFNVAIKARREANLELHRARDRRRYAENPDRQAAQKATAKAFYWADHERQMELRRAHYRNNPAAYKAYASKRKAAMKASHEPYSRREIYDRHDGRCALCNAEVPYEPGSFHLDHIIAISRGGTDTPDNLQLTCPSCNWAKFTT